jgi:hypothetical protein
MPQNNETLSFALRGERAVLGEIQAWAIEVGASKFGKEEAVTVARRCLPKAGIDLAPEQAAFVDAMMRLLSNASAIHGDIADARAAKPESWPGVTIARAGRKSKFD